MKRGREIHLFLYDRRVKALPYKLPSIDFQLYHFFNSTAWYNILPIKYYKDRRKENRFVPIFTQKEYLLCKEVLFYFDHLQMIFLILQNHFIRRGRTSPKNFLSISRFVYSDSPYKNQLRNKYCHFLILPYDLFPEFKPTVLFNIKGQSVYYHQLASKIIL